MNADSAEKPSGLKTDRSKFDFQTSSDTSSYHQAKSHLGSGLMHREKTYKKYLDGLVAKNSKTNSSLKLTSSDRSGNYGNKLGHLSSIQSDRSASHFGGGTKIFGLLG